MHIDNAFQGFGQLMGVLLKRMHVIANYNIKTSVYREKNIPIFAL